MNNTVLNTIKGALLVALPWLWYDTVNDEKTLVGPLVNILDDLQTHLDVKFDLHFQKQPIWGLKLPNGTWTGFYGMIQQRVADVILIPTAASSQRLELVEFSYPFYTSAVVILAGGSTDVPNNLFGYLMTFDMEVWVSVFVVMVILIVLSAYVEYFYGDVDKTMDAIPTNIWNFVASFFWEATPRNPKRQLGRLLLGLWLLSCLTLMNAFSGQFKSSLMVRKQAERIESIRDLSRAKSQRVLVWKGTVFEKIIMDSDLESLRKVAILVRKKNGLVNMKEMYIPENFRDVRSGKTVFITEESTLKSQLAKQCANGKDTEGSSGNMYLSRENVVPVHLYMALSKKLDVRVRNAISERLMSYSEAGLVNKWINEAFGDWKRCIDREDANTAEKDLGLSDLGSVFILWGLFLSLATISLIWEMIKHKYHQSRRVKKV